VIPRENARDLTLITNKLRSDKYDSFDALDADMQLMLANCYKFNVADERVLATARAFEDVYKKEAQSLRSSMPEDLNT